MSDHPDAPRVTLNDNGESLNIEEAVLRFRLALKQGAKLVEVGGPITFSVSVEMRPCDCDLTLNGRDEYCPLHGDKKGDQK